MSSGDAPAQGSEQPLDVVTLDVVNGPPSDHHSACAQCRARRVKCSMQRPCLQCTARGEKHLCTANDESVDRPVEASTRSEALGSVVDLLCNDDDKPALDVISKLSPAQMTELVREASNWAFRLDLQERIEQVRAQELGMLEEEG